jgi:hypothetical protein
MAQTPGSNNDRQLDDRPLWRKLLDPIRESYGDDLVSDEQLLRHVVHDLQWLLHEHDKLSHICQQQAKLLRKHGLGGYG